MNYLIDRISSNATRWAVALVLVLITVLGLTFLAALMCQKAAAQVLPSTNQDSDGPAAVPHLVKVNGSVKDTNGKPLTGIVGITFALYKDEQSSSPLWLEAQNVQLDLSGRYSVQLGAAKPGGLPAEIFASGEARWLGVQPEGQAEQPRVLLLSVPYALKAADAETLGGLPASAFMLAAPQNGNLGESGSDTSSITGLPATPATAVTGSGTIDFVPLWTSSSNLGNSVLFQSGSGSTAKVGINTSTPATTLDVKGGSTIRGTLQLPSTGTATASAGFNSQPLNLQASSFSSSTSKAVSQAFQWQTEPSGNNTANPTGTLNLLFGSGTSKPTETGLKITSTGLFTFATGQTFPGAGTITGVTAGTDLTGGGPSGNVTLNLDTTKVALLNATNTFVGNQTIAGNLNDTGNISATGSISGQTASFSGTTTGFGSAVLSVNQKGTTNYAISGFASATSGGAVGVSGLSSSVSGVGVSGEGGTGVLGIGYILSGGTGVSGSGKYGVQGTSSVSSGAGGVFSNTSSGEALSAQINGAEVFGVYPGGTLINGRSLIVSGNGVSMIQGDPGCGSGFAGIGFASLSGCNTYSMIGDGNSTYLNRPLGGTLFFRENNGTEMVIAPGGQIGIGTTGPLNGQLNVVGANGFYGGSFDGTGAGAAGVIANGGNGGSSDGGPGGLFVGGSTSNSNAIPGDAIDSYAGNNTGNGTQSWAGYFEGNVGVNGTLVANAKNFKIDHPLDPANKYLSHTSVESSEMMNIYTDNVVLDANGEATVQLADWFQALNRDFRYQLTCVGEFAPVYIAQEVLNGTFRIAGGRPGLKVSWQLTGVRQDAWANAHRIPVEEEKNARERGHYLHPELYGAPEEQSIQWARHPEQMKRIKEHRASFASSAKP